MRHTPGGGVCTEDAVQLLELASVPTGIDLPRLIDAASWLETEAGVPAKGFGRLSGPVPAAGDPARPLDFAWQS
jgi:hydroxymethylglutaryl-CoA lyase